MADAWATAFSVAVALALVGTPALRRAAVATGFLDQPAERKSHTTPIPYLGGLAIIVAALTGLAVTGEARWETGVLALAGAVVGLVGLLDDDRTLNPLPRMVAQLAAAGAAVAVGVRAEVSGSAAVDVVVTVIWIVGITNALNLLDNMDGLAGGVGFAAAAGIFGLAAFADQEVVGTVAAGLGGACLGFLAYNVRPAAIYMGDAGALFLGFALSIAALEADAALETPASFLVPLVLLALPVLDTTTVTVARLRHGRRVQDGGKDHLSHRLVARGLSPGGAVAALVGAQVALSGLAVAAGREAIPLPVAAAGALAVLGAVAVATWPAAVYPERAVGFSRGVRLVLAAGVLAAGLTVVPAVAAMALAYGPLDRAADQAKAGLDAARTGDAEEAQDLFRRSEASFRSAGDRLRLPLASLGLGVPVVSANLDAAREVAGIGEDLAAAGGRVAAEVDPERLEVVGGVVPVAAVRAVTPHLEDAATSLERALRRTRAIGTTALLPQVRDAVAELEDRLDRASGEAGDAAAAARVAPAILGGDGPRRYFLAVQNNAELRATGGFIGNFGEITATDGRLDLAEVRRISVLNDDEGPPRSLDHAPEEYRERYARFDVGNTWQNVNMSPDFPTVGGVVAGLYPQAGGREVDGVIAVDPFGLAAMLQLTGPVTVPEWPEPITADNVAEITLSRQYEQFGDAGEEERVDFLGLVAREAWARLTSGDLGRPARLGKVLGRAVRERHLTVWLRDAGEQAVIDRLGADGELPPVRSDSLLAVNQNAAGNKTDYYLHRALDYRVTVEPVDDGDRARVTGTLDLRLTNEAPATGLPTIVIGPYDERFQPGENRTYLSLYTPHAFTAATLDGAPLGLEAASELGREVYSSYVSLPAGATRTIHLDVEGEVRLGDGGWYALDLPRQALVHPDEVTVAVEPGDGWEIAGVRNLDAPGGRRATGTHTITEDTTVWVQVRRAGS